MRSLFSFVILLLLLLPSAAAQDSGKDQSKSQEQQGVPTFRVGVNVVNVMFTVKDKHNAFIPSLTKDDFDVFEDGKPQTIKYFSAETRLPLTLGILIDSSKSMERMLPEEKVVAGDFLRQVLTDKDLAFVISFDIDVDLLQDLTRDTHLLQAGLNRAKINWNPSGSIPGVGDGPVPTASLNRGTLLFDGVYLASHEVLGNQVGRKAMVILTDGSDEGSRMKLRDAMEAALKADAICYVLLISDPQYGYNMHDMRELSEQTGGRVITVNNPEKLHDAFDQIASELRSQYSLGYTPSNLKHDGSFRKLEIKSKHGYKVQARKGYYAPTS